MPKWKRKLKNIYLICAFFAILPFPILGVLSIKAHNEGEPQPTIEKPVAYKQRASIKYISRNEEYWIYFFYNIAIFSIPTAIIVGLFLQFGLKIRLDKS